MSDISYTHASVTGLQLKSQKFREARQEDWRKLNTLLDKMESRGLKALKLDELMTLPMLYRHAVSSLSMARSISLDQNLIGYLEALCGRAYVNVYGPQARFKDMMVGFFIKTLPQAVRNLWLELGLSFLIMVAGVVAAWVLCAHNNDWYDSFIPPFLAQGRGVDASADDLLKSLGAARPGDPLGAFAAHLMTHNISVAIGAFALGAFFGLPTLLAIFYNGVTLGAMLWLFYDKGLGLEFTGWLFIHGTTELLAITIAGACGFKIARSVMFAGDLPRLQVMKKAGEQSGTVMLGVAFMLVIAGLLEGIGRQTVTETWARFAIGGVMLVIWGLYFVLVGRKPKGRGA
jgi:uncharacterized membrane protein SpoIIM required for sporulation